MKLELDFYGALCATSTFNINGIPADSSDFGHHYDADPENAEDYGCGNRVFAPVEPTSEIFAKYRIDEAEYKLIAEALTEGLSFGSCGWCI